MEHVAPTKMIHNCKSHTIKNCFAYLSILLFYFCNICLQRLISNHYPRRFFHQTLGKTNRFFFRNPKKNLRRNSLGRRDSRSFCRNRPRPRRPTRSLGDGCVEWFNVAIAGIAGCLWKISLVIFPNKNRKTTWKLIQQLGFCLF